MEQKLLSYLILTTLSIGILMKILKNICENSRKEIPCEIIRICTLVYVNQDFIDKVPFHFSR